MVRETRVIGNMTIWVMVTGNLVRKLISKRKIEFNNCYFLQDNNWKNFSFKPGGIFQIKLNHSFTRFYKTISSCLNVNNLK